MSERSDRSHSDGSNDAIEFISINETCRLLDISRPTHWRWVKSGILPQLVELGPNKKGHLKSELREKIAKRPRHTYGVPPKAA
jgi:predicted DNA-binding transcriptional regulator AlpA